MGTKEKLIERFKRQPKDFTFDEMTKLLEYLVLKNATRERHQGHALFSKKKGHSQLCSISLIPEIL